MADPAGKLTTGINAPSLLGWECSWYFVIGALREVNSTPLKTGGTSIRGTALGRKTIAGPPRDEVPCSPRPTGGKLLYIMGREVTSTILVGG